MIQGTTPTLLYNLPFSTSLIKSAEITIEYTDNLKKVLIKKELSDCELGKTSIGIRLTQEETLNFPAPTTVLVQLRILTNDNIALATVPYATNVKKLLINEVIK